MHTDAYQLYSILGVDPAASDQAIHAAFRHRAKQLHPDSPGGNADAFIRLKRAYDVLSDPLQRAGYDRTCRPAPAAEPSRPRTPEPHRWAAPPPSPPPAPPPAPPLPPRSWRKTRSRGGIGLGRYVIAFIVMAAISLGGVQAMISLTQAPPSIRTRAAPETTSPAADPAPPAAESPAAPGSSKSGFWDPNPPAARKN